MGNAALRRRPAVEDRLTQPRRLVRQPYDVDHGLLRRLIRAGDLAPCFDAGEDAAAGHANECPICFYFYPSLNRSRCCGKGICTECFLQLMPSNASKVVHCPFCKKASYTVQYHGSRTVNEKKLEQEVRLFTLMDWPILDAIRDKLRQNLYISGSDILYQGGPVEKMVFIVRMGLFKSWIRHCPQEEQNVDEAKRVHSKPQIAGELIQR